MTLRQGLILAVLTLGVLTITLVGATANGDWR